MIELYDSFDVGRILFSAIAITAGYFALGWVQSLVEWYHMHELHSKLPAGPKPDSLIWGNFSQVARKDFHRAHEDWANKYGGVARYRWLHRYGILITEPSLVAEIMRSKSFDKHDWVVANGGLPSLLTNQTDDDWKAVRKGLAPAFSSANLREGFKHIIGAGQQLVKILRATGPDTAVDMDNLLSRESMDVIGQVGFDKDLGALRELEGGQGSRFLALSRALMHELIDYFRRPFRWLNPWDKAAMEGAKIKREYEEAAAALLADVHTRDAAGQLRASSIAAHLLRVQDPCTGGPLSDARLVPEVGMLFFAGFETTGHSAAFTLYCLSQSPDADAKVAEELDAHGLLAMPERPEPRPVQYEDLGKLPYLACCIKEAMRMHPVGGGSVRMALQDTVIGGGRYIIPRGCEIYLSTQAIHNSVHNFDQPERFMPERWREPMAEYAQPGGEQTPQPSAGAASDELQPRPFNGNAAAAAPGTPGEADVKAAVAVPGGRAKRFMPFSDGLRSCVGQSLATTNLTATLATLLGRFRFRLADEMGGPEGVRAAEQFMLTLSTDIGMKMHAIPRV